MLLNSNQMDNVKKKTNNDKNISTTATITMTILASSSHTLTTVAVENHT